MARGDALVDELLPLLEQHVTPELDAHAHERLTAMTDRYADAIARLRGARGVPAGVTRLDAVGRRFGVPPAASRRCARSSSCRRRIRPRRRPSATSTERRPPRGRLARGAGAARRSRAARRIADLGAGAGWPGLALAAALPEARVALVESAIRHCRYLERAVGGRAFANVEVVHARAEDWPAGLGAHDLVTARALAALPVLCEYAAPLLAEGGALVAWKGAVAGRRGGRGRGGGAQIARASSAVEVRAVEPFAGAERRTLHVFRKIAPTPERFPRRAGNGGQAPLGRLNCGIERRRASVGFVPLIAFDAARGTKCTPEEHNVPLVERGREGSSETHATAFPLDAGS